MCLLCGVCAEAMAFYQWMNLAHAEAPPDRPPLCINMDETALVRHVTGLRGCVAKASQIASVAVDRATLADRRSYMSYLACISDDVTVQDRLPQVILGNQHQLSVALMRSMDLPSNVVVWRQQSAWNSRETMRRWLSLLSKSLGELVKRRYVILLLDVHLSHIDKSIYVHARRCGVRLVYIPAKMTSFLQPCDTHLFAKFKHAFRVSWERTRSLSPGGVVSTASWMQVVVDAIQQVLPKTNWRSAFLSNGIVEKQRALSMRLRTEFGFDDGGVELPCVPPTAADALSIFPQRMKLDIMSYVLWQTKEARTQRVGQAEDLGQSETLRPKRRTLPPTFERSKVFRIPRTID